MIRFQIDNYKFRCGLCHTYDWRGMLIGKSNNYVLWMWNGYYFHILSENLKNEAAAREIACNFSVLNSNK